MIYLNTKEKVLQISDRKEIHITSCSRCKKRRRFWRN